MSGPSTAAEGEARRPIRLNDLLELTKPRITFMVVLTAGIGALLARRGELPLPLMLHALIGTALVSGGASAVNQILERESDSRMSRTAERPMPTGRLSLELAWAFSVAISVAGLVYLTLAVNWPTALLGLAAWASYILVYTPLKRTSSLSTLVGAVPGAIPPMMGWTAMTGHLAPGAWVLFGVLFFWQLPHFLAISWLCREDYGRAGFPMLSVIDSDGSRTGRQMILYSLALLPVSLMPTILGLTGMAYLVAAAVLGISMVWLSVDFARHPGHGAARRLMRFSIIYLPAVLVAMVLDRAL